MNILNLLNYSPDFGGGIAKHLLALGKLAKLNGHKLIIGFPKKREWQTELELSSQVIIIPEIENALTSGYRGIIRNVCKNNSIDIIHIHFDFRQLFSLALSIKEWDIPTIYQWHNPPIPLNEFLTPQNKLKGKTKRFYSGLVARFTDKRVIHHHISISNNITELIVNNSWTSSEKITFLPNGISRITPYENIPRVKSSDIPIIGTVANFRPEKDHETLLKAFGILVKSGIRSELWIVGDGPTKANMIKLADQLGIKSYVRFLGTLYDPSEAYNKFDVFVLSTYYEGHSLVLMEAMSFGLPIVATRVSSIPDVLTDGVNGLLVNPEDTQELAQALKNILINDSLYFKLSEGSLQNFKQQLSYADWAQSILSLYKNVLLKKKS